MTWESKSQEVTGGGFPSGVGRTLWFSMCFGGRKFLARPAKIPFSRPGRANLRPSYGIDARPVGAITGTNTKVWGVEFPREGTLSSREDKDDAGQEMQALPAASRVPCPASR